MAAVDWKAKFLNVYADLPAGERRQIIAVVDNESYTWNSAMIEIKQDTVIGKRMLEILKNLNILK